MSTSDDQEPDDGGVLPPLGKSGVKVWIENLRSPWKEVYAHIKALDPKGRKSSHAEGEP
jgi:hypothetical protein